MSKTKPAPTKTKKAVLEKVKTKKKLEKAKAHKKPVKKIPFTVTIQHPGIVEVYGEVISRSDVHITLRRRIHRSRGKFEDVTYPLSAVKAAFYINEPQATLLIDDPNHEYDVFEVSDFEVQGGMYVLTDEEDGTIHLCHPSITSVVQIRSAEDIPERTYKKRREEEDEDEEEERPVRKKKVAPPAPPVEEEDDTEDEEEDDAPPFPTKPVQKVVKPAKPLPPVYDDDDEDDEEDEEDEEESEQEVEVEEHDEDEDEYEDE